MRVDRHCHLYYTLDVQMTEYVNNWLFYGASTAKGHWCQRSVWAVYDHTQDTQGPVGRQKNKK